MHATGIDTRLISKNNGTTRCFNATSKDNVTGIVFDTNGCFVTCKPIGK